MPSQETIPADQRLAGIAHRGMKPLDKKATNAGSRRVKYGCDHPLALVIDPTEGELSALEQMLAKCPICSQWSPGDGPIMAVMSSQETRLDDGADDLI